MVRLVEIRRGSALRLPCATARDRPYLLNLDISGYAQSRLTSAIYHHAPCRVPFAGEGAYRLVDHVGLKPQRTGRDEWGVVVPLPAGYELGPAPPAESYAVGHPARSVAEAAALPLPTGGDAACFVGLFDRRDTAQTLLIGQHGLGLLDRFILLLGMQKALVALVAEPEAAAVVLERIADYHVAVGVSGSGERGRLAGRRLRRE